MSSNVEDHPISWYKDQLALLQIRCAQLEADNQSKDAEIKSLKSALSDPTRSFEQCDGAMNAVYRKRLDALAQYKESYESRAEAGGGQVLYHTDDRGSSRV